MGGSKTHSNTTKEITIRYAPYIEEKHDRFLHDAYVNRTVAINDSPYAEFDIFDIEQSFFGLGYGIADYPCLYEMFGKYMSAVDVEEVFKKAFSVIVGDDTIEEEIQKENQLLIDKMADEIVDYSLSMRSINAVNTSSFLIGKSVIESNKLKKLEEYSLNKRYEVIETAEGKFIKDLDFGRNMVSTYALNMKNYYMLADHTDLTNAYNRANSVLWQFKVMDFEQVALGTLQRAKIYQKTMGTRGRSSMSTGLSIASDTATGAYIGAQAGGVYGGVIGGAIGLVLGVARMFFEGSL